MARLKEFTTVGGSTVLTTENFNNNVAEEKAKTILALTTDTILDTIHDVFIITPDVEGRKVELLNPEYYSQKFRITIVNEGVVSLIVRWSSKVKWILLAGETMNLYWSGDQWNGVVTDNYLARDEYITDFMDTQTHVNLQNPRPYQEAANDQFGFKIKLTDKYLVSSAPRYGPGTVTDEEGIVYVFDVNTLEIISTINNPNQYGTTFEDRFGDRIDVSGDIVVVSCLNEDSALGNKVGVVYSFDAVTGNLINTFNNPIPDSSATDDMFGLGLSLDGDKLLISNVSANKLYLYDVNTGLVLSEIDSDSINAGCGSSIRMVGNKIVSGCPTYYGDQGKASIYDLDTSRWVKGINPITNPDYDKSDGRFGYCVDMNESYIAIGAPGINTNSGYVFIYDAQTYVLLHSLANPNIYSTGDADWFGATIAMNDRYIVVGAPEEDSAQGHTSGAAYVFDLSNGELVKTLDYLNNYSNKTNNRVGQSVAMSDLKMAIGSPLEQNIPNEGDIHGGSAAGVVYVF